MMNIFLRFYNLSLNINIIFNNISTFSKILQRSIGLVSPSLVCLIDRLFHWNQSHLSLTRIGSITV